MAIHDTTAEHGVPNGEEEALVKRWLVGLVERSPLSSLDQMQITWLAARAPALIAGIRSAALAPDRTEEPVNLQARAWASELMQLRGPDGGTTELVRDISVLHSLLVNHLVADAPDGDSGPSRVATVQRIGDVFTELYEAAVNAVERDREPRTTTDPLTGLPGPDRLGDWLGGLYAMADRYGQPFALISLQIDGLRVVTDSAGRAGGDAAIAMVAALVDREIRASDRVFRLGGDEFCVLAPQIRNEGAQALAKRLRKTVESCEPIAGRRLSISAGIAISPPTTGDAGEILNRAATARTQARSGGSGIAIAEDSGPIGLRPLP